MSINVIDPAVDLTQTMRQAIEAAIPGAAVEVQANSPGHFQLQVTSAAFAGKSLVQQQQMVYAAIAHLMKGENAPVHAIDQLRTKTAGDE
jgi:acid stress-induced BolA-like protein IbaG/YrbA